MESGLFSQPFLPNITFQTEVFLALILCKVRSLVTTCIVYAKLLQSYLTLCHPLGCSPPGPSVHGVLQARTLEWVAMPSSRGSFWPRDWTWISYVSCIGRWVLYLEGHMGSPVTTLDANGTFSQCHLFGWYTGLKHIPSKEMLKSPITSKCELIWKLGHGWCN